MTGSDENDLGKISIDADRYLKSLDVGDFSQSDAPRPETIEETRERIRSRAIPTIKRLQIMISINRYLTKIIFI